MYVGFSNEPFGTTIAKSVGKYFARHYGKTRDGVGESVSKCDELKKTGFNARLLSVYSFFILSNNACFSAISASNFACFLASLSAFPLFHFFNVASVR